MASYGLAFLAAQGFAPFWHYPWVTGLVFATGLVLVGMPARESQSAISG